MAVPFRSGNQPDAAVAGTLSVAGPIGRIGPDRYPEIAAALQAAALEMQDIWGVRKRQIRPSTEYAAQKAPAGSSQVIA
jgi:hypothetical protein